MPYTEQFTEVHQLLGTIEVRDDTGEFNSGYVSVGNAHRAFILIHVLYLDGTIDVDVEEAQDAAGTGAQNIAAKSITQITAETAVALIELRQEELTPGYSFINVELTIGGESAAVGVTVWATIPRYPPVPTTLFTEIVP